MKTTEKRTEFLFALVIPVLLAGCKSRPVDASPYVAETRDAGNPFVGVWESNGRGENGERFIYKFASNNQWEYYIVKDGEIMRPYSSMRSKGTYTYRGSLLLMMYVVFDLTADHNLGPIYGQMRGMFDGGVVKFGKPSNPYWILHPVPAED